MFLHISFLTWCFQHFIVRFGFNSHHFSTVLPFKHNSKLSFLNPFIFQLLHFILFPLPFFVKLLDLMDLQSSSTCLLYLLKQSRLLIVKHGNAVLNRLTILPCFIQLILNIKQSWFRSSGSSSLGLIVFSKADLINWLVKTFNDPILI